MITPNVCQFRWTKSGDNPFLAFFGRIAVHFVRYSAKIGVITDKGFAMKSADTRSPMAYRDDPKNWVAGLEKGLAIFDVFDAEHSRFTATEIAKLCGLSRTAARRYLNTLIGLGFFSTDGKLYWLTPKIMRLGSAYLESSRLPRLVQPALQSLAASTQEISYVSILDGHDVVYIARNGSNRSMNTGFVLGARIPAHTTAAGQLLLALQGDEAIDIWLASKPLHTYTPFTLTNPDQMRAHLQGLRRQDWAVSEQQFDLAYRGVAVPLRDNRGQVLAALNISMPMGNESTEHAVGRVLPQMQETAQRLRQLL